MQDYKTSIYKNYYKLHTKNLYGDASLDKIEKQFKPWQYYFGEYLPKDKEVFILDAGCGYGGFVHWLNKIGYKNSSGVDIRQELNSISQKLNISNVTCEDIFSFLEKDKERYDIIFARDLFEHFTKDKIYELGFLVYHSLKKEGVLIIQVPNGQSPMVGKIFHSDFTHETLFTHISIRQIFSTVGFAGFLVKEVTPVPKSLISFVRFLLWKLQRNILKLFQMIETGDASGYFSQNIIAVIKK